MIAYTLKRRLLIIGIGLISFLSNGVASILRESSCLIGLSRGLSQNNSICGDLYFGAALPFEQHNIEAYLGYSFFANETEYRGVRGLEFKSYGLFVEGNYFITEGLYGGMRFALNFNRVAESSQAKFDDYSDIVSPGSFTGTAGYGQIGYLQPIGYRFSLKVQGQVGIHSYKIKEGAILFNLSSYRRDAPTERHTNFLYNLSLGLMYRF